MEQPELTAVQPVKIVRRDTSGFRRIIAVSDIHGNLGALKAKLEEVKFDKSDLLILMGDYIERGAECLELTEYLINLTDKPNVAAIAGNCDNLIEELFKPVYRRNLTAYLKENRNNIVNEILRNEGQDIDSGITAEEIFNLIERKYPHIRKWLEQLPHIVEANNCIFVHAALSNEQLELNEVNSCLKSNDFFKSAKTFRSTLVVGHMPLRLIREDKKDDILFDEARNIYFIDGGMGTFPDGKLNALILELKC